MAWPLLRALEQRGLRKGCLRLSVAHRGTDRACASHPAGFRTGQASGSLAGQPDFGSGLGTTECGRYDQPKPSSSLDFITYYWEELGQVA